MKALATAASTLLLVISCASSCVIDEVREDDVGDAPACRATALWSHDWGGREDDLLEAINDVRATGAMCGERTRDPVPDLEVAPALRCAARRHAVDQSEGGTLSHDGNDGSSTLSRIDLAQYPGVPSHELLAGDFLDPEATLEAWLASPTECEALLSSTAAEFGPGFARSEDGGSTTWVLLIGELRD